MSIPLTPTALSNALSQRYTLPTLPSLGSAEAQAKSAAGALLQGGNATNSAGTGTGAGAPAATTNAAVTPFHHLVEQAMAKTAQGMASHTATQAGIHPDQSRSQTNAQAVTGHAVSITA
jgi:hypothetical protein